MTDPQTPILFLDFDGTISSRDAVDAILEKYADPRWLAFEADWRAGRIGSRDCLRAQMSLVRASSKQIDALLDEIGIDEELAALLQLCTARGIPFHIVSDGFDYCIRRILSAAGKKLAALLRGGRVCAAHLESRGRVWHTEFPFFHQACGHGCATCKPAVMRLLNRTNAPAIFVGDGLSDRYAIKSADVVFAKDALAEYCNEQSLEYFPYQNLAHVAGYIDRLAGRVFLLDKTQERVSA